MKAKFNYGDDKKDFIILDVPNEYLIIERLTYVSCDAEFSKGGDNKIYWDTYNKFLKDVTKLFCKSAGIKMRRGLIAEFAVKSSKYKLEFDIVQYPTL